MSPNDILNQMIQQQQHKLLSVARRIYPHLTDDDLLQPNDFPELETNGDLRYEEGILHGLMAAQAALNRNR